MWRMYVFLLRAFFLYVLWTNSTDATVEFVHPWHDTHAKGEQIIPRATKLNVCANVWRYYCQLIVLWKNLNGDNYLNSLLEFILSIITDGIENNVNLHGELEHKENVVYFQMKETKFKLIIEGHLTDRLLYHGLI